MPGAARRAQRQKPGIPSVPTISAAAKRVGLIVRVAIIVRDRHDSVPMQGRAPAWPESRTNDLHRAGTD